jgi:hypothetical protein
MPEYQKEITLNANAQGYLLHQSLIRFKHTKHLIYAKVRIKFRNVKNLNTSNPQIKNLVSKVTIFRFTLAVFCAFL